MVDDKKVTAPVLWDNDNTFQNGKYFTVSAASIVVGVAYKPSGISIPQHPGEVDQLPTLQIKDPVYNDLFLNLTLDGWRILVGDTNISPSGSPLPPYVWLGGTDVPAGCIISDPRLHGIVILSINKGGITIYQYTYTDGNPNGTLDLTADGCLATGEYLQIFYKLA